jgi:type IV pilus assembly protein PilE
MHGVTLMELLIVVVIISILAAIAYPNYRSYVQRSKRSEAISALLQIAVQQERHYLNNNTYTDVMTNLGFPVAGGYVTDTGTYEINVTAADANSFTATAQYRLADEEAAKCDSFTINADGNKTSEPRADCWTNTR